jgi:hypothetical protein
MRKLLPLLAGALLASATCASAQEIDWSKVDAAFGRKAAVTGDVHRYGFPRTDLKVTLDGVAIKPALALGGWVALKPAHGGAMVMGDLVLLESEINPVMTALINNGLEITAVHNHVLRASPATFYIHVGGHGDPAKIATTIVQALQSSQTPLAPPTAAATPAAIDLDTAQLDQIIGVQLPADRRWQGRDHRRLRARRRRGQPGDQGAALERHRGDGDPQSHADRAATPDLHALLGQR